MNVGINLKNRTATVIRGKDRTVTKLLREELKPLMSELCDDEVLLNALRFSVKNFGTNKILFKDVT